MLDFSRRRKRPLNERLVSRALLTARSCSNRTAAKRSWIARQVAPKPPPSGSCLGLMRQADRLCLSTASLLRTYVASRPDCRATHYR